MKKLIVHVAEMEITEDTGMGRVAFLWQQALEKRGFEFLHIGLKAAGPFWHSSLFPFKAREAYRRLGRQADLFLVHEPASGAFVGHGAPTFVFSHGLERRHWQQRLANPLFSEGPMRLRTRMLVPLWRLAQCDRGMRKAQLLFLLNSQDVEFAKNHYKRKDSDIFMYRTGVDLTTLPAAGSKPERFTIIFNGTWIPRKGISTLIAAASLLKQKGHSIHWKLIATHQSKEVVLKDWPEELREAVEVIPSFGPGDERRFLQQAHLFVLPSLFEGQPASLLQAMAAGLPCVTSDCCGQRDIIVSGANGMLHPPGDATELARLIELCIHNGALREKLGKAAQASVQDRSWEIVADEVAQEIEKSFSSRGIFAVKKQALAVRSINSK